MSQQDVTIVNKYGLHVRPTQKFVETANQFESDIFVSKNGQEVNGKSMIALLGLEATVGTGLTIRGDGSDSEEAVKTLAELVHNKFGILDE